MTPEQTDVSFVIASRNRSAELAAVLQRLLDTTACHIVVVDNHSTDDSRRMADGVAARSGGRVQTIALGRNMGAVGRNIGVTACASPYIAFCDDDSWWAPEVPAMAADLFDRYPSVGLLAARTVVLPGGQDDPMTAQLADSPLGHGPHLPGPSILGFLACAAIVRRTAFTAAGGFSEILHFRGEEELLALDMATLGWDLCYCAALTAFHQPSSVRATTAAQDARSLRNAVLTTWLRRPLVPCARATATLIKAAAQDRDHARAAVEALRRLPAVARQRRPLPGDVESALARLQT